MTSSPWCTPDDHHTLSVVLGCMLVYTLVLSIADGVTNRFYKRVWPHATGCRRRRLLFYLVLHNGMYFLLYVLPIVLLACYSFVRLGWFVLYLLGLVGLQLHWWTNNDRCGLTDIQNQLLGIDDNNTFRDPYAVVTNTYPRNSLARSRKYHQYTIGCAVVACVVIGFKAMGH